MTNKISVVIPTYNRVGLLKQHLLLYNDQTVSSDAFEVVVVNDGGEEFSVSQDDYRFKLTVINQDNSGPARARNEGVKNSSGNIILFVGDDCIPGRNLIFRHLYNHIRNEVRGVVQGYTPWHPAIYDRFLQLIEKYSLQVNWKNIKNEDGSWQYRINPGYCVTTNYSIDKSVFELMNGFDENFKAAAWEDIEFGFRAMKVGFPHFFDSGAANYHYHQYDIHEFAKRQRTEGFWRVLLCLKHPDFVEGLMDPEQISSFNNVMRTVNQSLFPYLGVDTRTDEHIEEDITKYLMSQSIVGIKNGFNHFDERLNYIQYASSSEIARKMVFAIDAVMRGDNGFALHCCQWLTDAENSILIHKFCKEIKLEIYGADNREVMFHDLAITQLEIGDK